MRIVVVIPVVNEAPATRALIPLLNAVRSELPPLHEFEVLYVDGWSNDGTTEIIREFQTEFPWLHLLMERERRGLGGAYALGMQYAMRELKADAVMEFDGDMQHPADQIPALVAALSEGYDYVIGSRFVKGGSTPKEWGISRKFLSVVGNWIARFILLLPHVHDVTSGFKLARTQGFLEHFDFNTLASLRYAYKIHLLYFMIKRGARTKEVPIRFAPRKEGESKLIRNDIIDTLRVIFTLRLRGP